MYSIYLCRCPITDQREALWARGGRGGAARAGGGGIKSGIALTSKLG